MQKEKCNVLYSDQENDASEVFHWRGWVCTGGHMKSHSDPYWTGMVGAVTAGWAEDEESKEEEEELETGKKDKRWQKKNNEAVCMFGAFLRIDEMRIISTFSSVEKIPTYVNDSFLAFLFLL